MKRIDPTFKQHELSLLKKDELLDEFLTILLDSDDLSSESDAIPDLSILDRRATRKG